METAPRSLGRTLAVSAMGLALLCSVARAIASSTASIVVDFDQPVRNVRSMSGFLLSMTRSNPPEDRVRPLRPRLWRATTQAGEIADRTAQLGTRLTVIVSDLWGYDPAKAPYTDYARFDDFVRRLAEKSKGLPVIFDIWNEPNGKDFWHGTTEQVLETFKHAHDAIRSVRPDAVIAGPSIWSYNPTVLRGFLDYCLAHNMRLDVLTWHEFRSGDKIGEIADSLREARREFVENPKYRPVGIREIHVNEAVTQDIQYKPASILAVLASLEAGGADAAARACFDDSRGQSNCWNNTLDGILTPGNYEPRAAWWVYKAYAESVDGRVSTKPWRDGRVIALASRGATGEEPRVLLGLYAGDRKGESGQQVELVLNHLSAVRALRGAKTVRVRVARIPDSGEAAVPTLPTSTPVELEVKGDAAQREVPLRTEEVLVLMIERGAS